MAIKKYRKKPLEVEAIQLTKDNEATAFEFCEGKAFLFRDGMISPTLEGKMTAFYGDYIIKGIQGEFYPCKPDIFKQTYEECE